jgi:hypothetical protein
MKKNENGRQERRRVEKIEKAYAKAQRLVANAEFQKDVQLIREEWNINTDITTDIVLSLQWSEELFNNGLSEKFREDVINRFIKGNKYQRFGVNSDSFRMLESYIFAGSLNMLDTIFPHIDSSIDKVTGQTIYRMTFYEHSTVDDIKLAFVGYKANQMPKTREWQPPDRVLRIAKEAKDLKSNMTWRQVSDKINDEFNQAFTAETMRKLVDQYNKYM